VMGSCWHYTFNSCSRDILLACSSISILKAAAFGRFSSFEAFKTLAICAKRVILSLFSGANGAVAL
jgi:hypothetical protein